jgi:hypothetical protein
MDQIEIKPSDFVEVCINSDSERDILSLYTLGECVKMLPSICETALVTQRGRAYWSTRDLNYSRLSTAPTAIK